MTSALRIRPRAHSRLWCALALGSLITFFGCVGQAVTDTHTAVMPIPDSWEKTLGFLDWARMDMSEAEIRQNAPNYSFVWSGINGQPNYFRSANQNISVGRYLPGFYDDYNGRPEAFPEGPGQDTPAGRARTLRWWNTEVDGVGHPDWVVYRCDGFTPAYYLENGQEAPNMPLDITNPSVIDWQIRNGGAIDGREPGYTAFSADMVLLINVQHACGIYRDGEWRQLFSGDEQDPLYAAAVIGWAGRVRAQLHQLPSPRGLVANFALEAFQTDDDIAALAANLDGILDEQGFTGFGLGRLFASEEAWLHKVRNMIAIQDRGVALYSMNYVSMFPPTADDLDWILSSFLMAKEHSAYVLINHRYPGARWPHLPEYEEDMGHPCARMRLYQNVYLRDYSKGIAVANPSASFTFTVQLPAESFRALDGRPSENILVFPPLTGKVLLSTANRCP